MKKWLIIPLLLLTCEEPYKPDRVEVWLYPDDVFYQAGDTLFFDIDFNEYEDRRGSEIMAYREWNDVYRWLRLGSPIRPGYQHPYFAKLALEDTYGSPWRYAYFEWDSK